MKHWFCATIGFFFTALVAPALVQVEYYEPDNYWDFEISGIKQEVLAEKFSKEIAELIERMIGDELPPDSTVTILFRNIDLAGAYEPWRGGMASDIRIFKEKYVPRLHFDYTLIGDDGTVLKQGEANVTDLNYLSNPARKFNESDIFFYEKEVIEHWVRSELGDFSKPTRLGKRKKE